MCIKGNVWSLAGTCSVTWGGTKDDSMLWLAPSWAGAGARHSRLVQASSQELLTVSSLELQRCRSALGHAFPLRPLQGLLVGSGATVTCSTESSWIKTDSFPKCSLPIMGKSCKVSGARRKDS